MINEHFLCNNVTILVSSCDTYSDLWEPFFILWRKYASDLNVKILLNTESLDFQMEGLDIECVHFPNEKWYGKRFLNALSKVKTKYVISVLDDFFLRSPINLELIKTVVQWMEEDPDIACFNCDPNQVYHEYEAEKFPGFHRIPPGNDYTLSMQAGIWRTDKLKQFWKPYCSPWEWELICNAITFEHPRDKFYSLTSSDSIFLDYGHYRHGDIWGVFRGKWILEDVKPLFEKEEIEVDFSTRGIYTPENEKVIMELPKNSWIECKRIGRCLGLKHFLKSLVFAAIRDFRYWRDIPVKHHDYCAYLEDKARKRFLKRTARGE